MEDVFVIHVECHTVTLLLLLLLRGDFDGQVGILNRGRDRHDRLILVIMVAVIIVTIVVIVVVLFVVVHHVDCGIGSVGVCCGW